MKNNYKEVKQLAETKGYKIVKSEELGNRAKAYYLYTLYLDNTEKFNSEKLKDVVEYIMSAEQIEETVETEIINTLDFGEIAIFKSIESYEGSTKDSIDLIKNEVFVSSESGLIELGDGDYIQPYVTFRGEVVGIEITD